MNLKTLAFYTALAAKLAFTPLASSAQSNTAAQQAKKWDQYLRNTHEITHTTKGPKNKYQGLNETVYHTADKNLKFVLLTNERNNNTNISEVIIKKDDNGRKLEYITYYIDSDSDGSIDGYQYNVKEIDTEGNKKTIHSFDFQNKSTSFTSYDMHDQRNNSNGLIDQQHYYTDTNEDGPDYVMDLRTNRTKKFNEFKWKKKNTDKEKVSIHYKQLIPNDPLVNGDRVFDFKSDPNITPETNIDDIIANLSSSYNQN